MNFELSASQLKIELNNLPGESSHIPLLPVNRPLSSKTLKNKTSFKESAVAIYLFDDAGEIKSILIERTKYKGHHSGQVSFPGGKKEKYDINLEQTARRESKEEVNISESEGLFLGQLTEVYIPISNFRIQPFVFFLNEVPALKREIKEVESIITFKVSDLILPDAIKHGEVQALNDRTLQNAPFFSINGHKVDHNQKLGANS